MKIFDINIWIYAHRVDQPDHAFYRDYVETTLHACDAFALSPLVAAGFVRVVTNSRFPNGPTPLPQALATIDSIVALDHCHWIMPGQRHWQLLSNLCRQGNCTGKLVADAQHAAMAIEHGCQWVTRDPDFETFVSHGLQLEMVMPPVRR